MAKIVTSESSEIVSRPSVEVKDLSRGPAWVRVSPNNYLIASFLATFFAGLFIYLEIDLAAAITLVAGWVVIPFLLWGDRIVFDGVSLVRTGLVPRIWGRINGSETALLLADVEQVETQSLRALKRGGSVFYRYRTMITGNDSKVVFASGGENYRRMIKSLLPVLSENLLDNRSMELRDYLSEPKETLMKAEFAKVPSTEVLEEAVNDFETLRKESRKRPEFGDAELEKAEYLRTLANELRLSGFLLQALEVFRRALFLNPKDGWLLFEFARCLHSFAGAEKNSRLEKRALAVLRLAERRAAGDPDLLARLGESYFQYGEWSRALKVFKKTLVRADNSFRSVRGLAEISLREGKIAHVIHHFSTAHRLAETPALRRWTQTEADYFTKLNSDDKYMDMEVSRVNLLETLERSKVTSLRIAMIGLPAILVGIIGDIEILVNVGWAVSCVSLLIWVGIIISKNILSERVPIESETEN